MAPTEPRGAGGALRDVPNPGSSGPGTRTGEIACLLNLRDKAVLDRTAESAEMFATAARGVQPWFSLADKRLSGIERHLGLTNESRPTGMNRALDALKVAGFGFVLGIISGLIPQRLWPGLRGALDGILKSLDRDEKRSDDEVTA